MAYSGLGWDGMSLRCGEHKASAQRSQTGDRAVYPVSCPCHTHGTLMKRTEIEGGRYVMTVSAHPFEVSAEPYAIVEAGW